MVYFFHIVSAYFLLLLLGSSCLASQPSVFVSILPQKFFVQQISGDKVHIDVMVQPGASPSTYEPKASQMKKLLAAKAYLAIGVPFEQSWLDRIAGVNPGMLIVHTDEGITKLKMKAHGHDDEHTGDLENHDHEDHRGLDPHIWLSPRLVKKQVSILLQTLVELFPEHAQLFEQNSQQFVRKIDNLDVQLRSILENKTGKSFMVFHPSWGYFAKEYGFEQIAVEIEGKKPKPAQLKDLIKRARKEDIRVIFAQPQFSRKNAQLIAREINGEVITLDPLAENWLENMEAVAERLGSSIN